MKVDFIPHFYYPFLRCRLQIPVNLKRNFNSSADRPTNRISGTPESFFCQLQLPASANRM